MRWARSCSRRARSADVGRMSTSAPGAVVIGGYANAVGVVRSLGEKGVPVAVVLTMPQDIAHHSRHASEHERLEDLAGRPDSLVELLERRARDWAGRVVIPTNDHALTVLARHRDHMSAHYRIPVPPWEITRGVVEKDRTRRAASEVGIDVPGSFGSATADATRLDLPYPVVVKPYRGHQFPEHFGKKLILVRSRPELETAVNDIERADIPCEIQELIPGGDDQHYDFYTYRTKSGDFVGDFMKRKLRQSPPFFGVTRAAEPAHVPSLREPSYELIKRLEWRGFAHVAYKRDPRSGRFYLMEVNGRCPLVNGLARRAGIDVPFMIYSGSAYGEVLGIRPNGWSGVWLHLHADLLYTALYWRDESLDWKAFWNSYRRPKTDAVWSPTDPLPFFMEWWHTLRKAVRPTERRRMLDRVQAPGREPETPNEETRRS